MNSTPTTGKQKKGLACLPLERVREIASLGGKASQAAGTGYRWTSETAKEAGRKGGAHKHPNKGNRTSRRQTI